jgi:hypothetical protein
VKWVNEQNPKRKRIQMVRKNLRAASGFLTIACTLELRNWTKFNENSLVTHGQLLTNKKIFELFCRRSLLRIKHSKKLCTEQLLQ